MTHPYQYHVFVCTQQKLEDKVYCKDQGAEEVLHELQRQVEREGLSERVEVTPCGCFGLCRRGPVLVVYPEGTWYAGIRVEDVPGIVESHFKNARPVDHLMLTNPDRLRDEIKDEKARARSRDIAHVEAGVLSERLRRLAGDFQASRAFLTAVELDLFTCVGDGATAAEAADRMGTSTRSTEMLLNALAAIGLLVKDDDVFRNSPDTGRFLQRGLPDDARAAVMNRVNMWDTWSTLTDCLREGSPTASINSGPSATQAYIAATHRIANLAAPAMVASLDLPQVRKVLDVGGGSGAYTVAFLKAFPDATAVLMDLPPVIRVATRYIREASMEERISLTAGDFMLDPLGSGFDLVLLSYVLHLNPAEANKRLLTKAFAALEPGGRVVINDYVLNADKTLPRAAALYALNMLVSTQGGSVYSFEEIAGWLRDVGFGAVKKIELLGPTDVVTAEKSG
jgi:(2Fe-2S) ferredoxin/SAM-dependent methyltransferase